MGSKEAMKVNPSRVGLVPCRKETQELLSSLCSLPHEDIKRFWQSKECKSILTRTQPWLQLDLRLLASATVRYTFLLLVSHPIEGILLWLTKSVLKYFHSLVSKYPLLVFSFSVISTLVEIN